MKTSEREPWAVAIVGGGPAGAATALALARHAPALRVLILEASDYGSPRLGETLAPSALPLLDQLGLREGFAASGARPAAGTLSTWGLPEGQVGGDDAIASPAGPAWHLDRRAFDAWLAESAAAAGATLWRGCRVDRAVRAESGWRLEVVGDGHGGEPVTARCLIDATGRRAALATRLGARRVLLDDQVALYAFFTGGKDDRRTLIEPIADGWFYASRLPDERLAIAFFTDGALLKREGLREPSALLAKVAQTFFLRQWLEGAELVEGPIPHTAAAGHLSPVAGEGWLAVGDAAFSLDPLSGQGLVKALANAFWAAYAVADLLQGGHDVETDPMARYRAATGAELEPYLRTRNEIYRQETRWPAAPYWQRRRLNRSGG